MANVEFHPAARAELTGAAESYLVRSAMAAIEFAREIERAIERIGEFPQRYPVTRKVTDVLFF